MLTASVLQPARIACSPGSGGPVVCVCVCVLLFLLVRARTPCSVSCSPVGPADPPSPPAATKDVIGRVAAALEQLLVNS